MISEHAINLPLDVALMTLLFGLFVGGTWLVEKVTDRDRS